MRPLVLLAAISASWTLAGVALAQSVPPPPPIDDPMLVPVPPAKRELATWQDALALVHARSTDLQTAFAEIRRAEAQSRIALAAVLPAINGAATAPHQLITKEVPAAGGTTGAAGATGGTTKVPAGDFVNANVTLLWPIGSAQSWYGIEIEQARRSVTVAEQSLEVARQARDLAAEVDRLTQTAYRAGQGTSLELVVAASALRQAEIELALGEFSLVRARLEALFALAKCST